MKSSSTTSKSVRKKVALNDITVEQSMQMRVSMDQGLVEEYISAIEDKADEQGVHWPFERILIVSDEKDNWLVDGFHRVEAAKETGLKTIPALIEHGDKAYAVTRAAGVNATHGKRRTPEDIEKAVHAVLALPGNSSLSTAAIAMIVNISRTTATKYRANFLPAEPEQDASTRPREQVEPDQGERVDPPPVLRTGLDGRTRNVSKTVSKKKPAGVTVNYALRRLEGSVSEVSKLTLTDEVRQTIEGAVQRLSDRLEAKEGAA